MDELAKTALLGQLTMELVDAKASIDALETGIEEYREENADMKADLERGCEVLQGVTNRIKNQEEELSRAYRTIRSSDARENKLIHRIRALVEKLTDNAPDCDWGALDGSNPMYNLHQCDAVELRFMDEGDVNAAILSHMSRHGGTPKNAKQQVERAAAIHGIY